MQDLSIFPARLQCKIIGNPLPMVLYSSKGGCNPCNNFWSNFGQNHDTVGLLLGTNNVYKD
jgi:hypothetical protein